VRSLASQQMFGLVTTDGMTTGMTGVVARSGIGPAQRNPVASDTLFSECLMDSGEHAADALCPWVVGTTGGLVDRQGAF
jgi:hypothetical protein